MKRTLVLLATILLAWSVSGNAAITQVQHATGTATAAPAQVTFANPTTTGDTIIVEIESNSSRTVSSIADTAGDTFIRAVTSTANSSGQIVEVWYAQNITGHASNTVTFTLNTAPTYESMYIQEWSGLTAATTLDTTASATGSGTALATGSFAITSGDLVIGVGVSVGGNGSAGAGFTAIDTDTFSMAEYQKVSATSVNVTETAITGSWTIVGAAFKAASVSPCSLQPTSTGWTWVCPQISSTAGNVCKVVAFDGLDLSNGHQNVTVIRSKYGGTDAAWASALGGPSGRFINQGINTAGQYSYTYAANYPVNGIPSVPTVDIGAYLQQDRFTWHLKNMAYVANPDGMTCNGSGVFFEGETPDDWDPAAQADYNALAGTTSPGPVYTGPDPSVRFYVPDDGDSLFLYDSVPTHNDGALIIGANSPIQTTSDPIWAGGTFSFSNKTRYSKVGMADYLAGEYGCVGAGISITSLTENGYIATAVAANNFTAGQMVMISGATPSGYNTTYPVLVMPQGLSSTQFKYVIPGTVGLAPGTGTVKPVESALVTTGTDAIGLPTCGSTLIASSLSALNTAWGTSYTTWGTSDSGGLAGIASGTYASWGTGTGLLDENGSHIINASTKSTCGPDLPFYTASWGNTTQLETDLHQFVGISGALHLLRQRVAYNSACSGCAPLSDLVYDGPLEVYQQGAPYLDLIDIHPFAYSTLAAQLSRAQTIINNTSGVPVGLHDYSYTQINGPPWTPATSITSPYYIIDSNGNVELATTSGTTGSGAHPTWPTVQGNTVADNTVTWQLYALNPVVSSANCTSIECQATQSARGAEQAAYWSGALRDKNPQGKYAVVEFSHWMTNDWANLSSQGQADLDDNVYDGSQVSTLSSCSGTWASTHSYSLPACITDANGNKEFLNIAGEPGASCTSGSSAPTWKTGYGQTSSDGSCQWDNGSTYPLNPASVNTGNYIGPLTAFFQSNLCDPPPSVVGSGGTNLW